MTDINRLIDIARSIGMDSQVAALERIAARSANPEATLLLPFVGEFSSGKTSLINALTDSKALATATEPTTATIFEIHFSADACRALIVDEQGQVSDITDIEQLRTDRHPDAKAITLFDTSRRVPESVIIVDTPGLSSPDARHRQTLVDFVPAADGVVLVVDINSQMTRSLTDFAKTMALAKKPLYLVLTKSDTKTEAEVEASKKYIAEHADIPLERVIAVSAQKDRLDELDALVAELQSKKGEIMQRVDAQRMADAARQMIQRIDQLLAAATTDKQLEAGLRDKEFELKTIQHNISELVDEVNTKVADVSRRVTRQFEDQAESRLMGIAVDGGPNVDARMVDAINSLTSVMLSQFKQQAGQLFADAAATREVGEGIDACGALRALDLSAYSVQGLSYGLDLASMGHGYDGLIKGGMAVVATVAAVAAAGPALAAAGTALAEGGAVATAISAADTISDVASIVSNQRMRRTMKAGFQAACQQVEANKESIISGITDKMIGKPQRKRAVRQYVEGSLVPEFKAQMDGIATDLSAAVRNALNAGAAAAIDERNAVLARMRDEYAKNKDALRQRTNQLKDYKTELQTI